MKRRRFLGAAGGLPLALSGCAVSLADGRFNDCAPVSAPDWRRHPLVAAAWRGLDPRDVWDAHCHMLGEGDGGSGIWINPQMKRPWYLMQYLRRAFYLNASCAGDAPGRVDESVVARLLAQCEAMPDGFRALLFAFDWARDTDGRPLQDRSAFHVPDGYVAALAERYPSHFEWVASIHPYDPDALERLDAAAARGARAVKWLPSAQGIDPGSPRCDRFYAKLAEQNVPLISHGGDERAVHGFDEALGNPLRLRRPLAAGVRVVIAHCASLGEGRDLDGDGMQRLPNFTLFGRLMDDPAYARNLAGDISAITQINRMDVIATLLARRDWHPRLLNGSDYPLPGVVPLISLPALAERGLIESAAVGPLRELREHNVLLFDFVLKRSLASNGSGFDRAVFESRRFFVGRR